MAAELVVRAHTINPQNYVYGRYRVWGDVARSRFFRVPGQPAIEDVLRELSIRPAARILGQGFQGLAAVRRITAADHARLSIATQDLPLEPRAHAPPEEALEAAILTGNPTHLHAIVPAGETGIGRRWERLVSGFARSARLVSELRELYGGRCQVCEWSPKAIYATDLCESHHAHWLSRGGADDLRNMVLLCPNHHRAVHGRDALLDFSEAEAPAFDFGDHRERLRLDRHLLAS